MMLPSLTFSRDTRQVSGFPCFLSCLVQRFKDVAFPHLQLGYLHSEWLSMFLVLSCLVQKFEDVAFPHLQTGYSQSEWLSLFLVLSCLVWRFKDVAFPYLQSGYSPSEWLSMFLVPSCLVPKLKDIAFPHRHDIYLVSALFNFLLKFNYFGINESSYIIINQFLLNYFFCCAIWPTCFLGGSTALNFLEKSNQTILKNLYVFLALIFWKLYFSS